MFNNYQHARQQHHHVAYACHPQQFSITGQPPAVMDDHASAFYHHHQAPIYQQQQYIVHMAANPMNHPAASMPVTNNMAAYPYMPLQDPFNYGHPHSQPAVTEFAYAQSSSTCWQDRRHQRHNSAQGHHYRSNKYQPQSECHYRFKRGGSNLQQQPPRRPHRPSEVNMQKACTSCRRLWQHCRCANIKNRPDPKPYEKFVPPRLLNKGSAQIKPQSEC